MNTGKRLTRFVAIFVMVMMILSLGGPTLACEAFLTDNLGLDLPCVQYQGNFCSAWLSFAPGKGEPCWGVSTVGEADPKGDCAWVNTNHDLMVPAVAALDHHFGITLAETTVPDGSSASFWCLKYAYEVAPVTEQRDGSLDCSQVECQRFTEPLHGFAWAFYRAVSRRQSGENLFFSPYSLYEALTMVYMGARGETAREMANVLEIGEDSLGLLHAIDAVNTTLEGYRSVRAINEGNPFHLKMANSLWIQQGFSLLQSYADSLYAYFGARPGFLDFIHDPNESRRIINGWVEDRTDGRIRDLIPPDGVSPQTRMVLANAVHFLVSWFHPFPEASTAPGTFHRLANGPVQVSMMKQSASLEYVEGSHYQAVSLPYVGEKVVMTVVVPDEGSFGEVEEEIDVQWLRDLLLHSTLRRVNLTLPRFRIETSLSLADLLSSMGMPLAFTAKADFSGMDGRQDLMVGNVFHKAWVEVDEAGTEAAAATAVVMELTSVHQSPVELVVDRPFLFIIHDRSTGAILFIGRVMDPGRT